MATISSQTALSILKKAGIDAVETALEPLAYTQVLLNPTSTDTEISSTLDGQFKHQARQTIGWAVDIIWPFIETYLDAQIEAAITAARAEIATENTAAAASTDASASTVTPVKVETSTALAG